MITDKQFLKEENEEEILSVIDSFLTRLTNKAKLEHPDFKYGCLDLPILDTYKFNIVKDMIEDFRAYKEPCPDYKKAFELLMTYWDSLPDEEKPKIDKQLKKLGL